MHEASRSSYFQQYCILLGFFTFVSMTGENISASKMINQFACLSLLIIILFLINGFLIGRLGMIVMASSKCLCEVLIN